MPPFARASALDRLFACPGSLLLPNEPQNTGEAAAYGNDVHSWAETGRYPRGKNGELLKRKVTASGASRSALWPGSGHHEVAMAYNVITSEVSCRFGLSKAEAKAWHDSLDDEWVTGSADFAMDLMGRPWVDDLKTGRYGHWEKYAKQQTFYTMAWGLHLTGDHVESLSTITHWPKYPLAEPPSRNETILPAHQLTDFALALAALRTDVLRMRASGSQEALRVGDHCYFCPSKAHCAPYIANSQQKGTDNE